MYTILLALLASIATGVGVGMSPLGGVAAVVPAAVAAGELVAGTPSATPESDVGPPERVIAAAAASTSSASTTAPSRVSARAYQGGPEKDEPGRPCCTRVPLAPPVFIVSGSERSGCPGCEGLNAARQRCYTAAAYLRCLVPTR